MEGVDCANWGKNRAMVGLNSQLASPSFGYSLFVASALFRLVMTHVVLGLTGTKQGLYI